MSIFPFKDKIDAENLKLCQKVKEKLQAALGTDGMLILDNEVEFLINLCDGFLHFEGDE